MRSLVFAAVVTVAAPGCDASPAPGELDADRLDASEVASEIEVPEDAPLVRDTSEVEVALACRTPELAAGVVVGRDDEAWCFEAIGPEAELEIVRGIQGGIHVELRLALASVSPDAPAMSFEVELVRTGTTLARFASGLVALLPLGVPAPPTPGREGGSAWATSAFPVVFASADASLYHGLAAEIRAHVVIDGRPVDLAPIDVYLLDPTSTQFPPR